MCIFAKTYCPGKWSFEVPGPDRREADNTSMPCWILELSVHTHDAVFGSLRATKARVRGTCYIMKQLAIFFVTNAMKSNMVERFLSEAQQHPGVPCKALKYSSQLPASFLEEVVPIGTHSLQVWMNDQIMRPLLVAIIRSYATTAGSMNRGRLIG